jgi:hypothetical protein
MSEVVVQKIPSLTCEKCGSFRVMMTDDGPECRDCDVASTSEVDLSTEIEYLIYQLNCKESK